MSSPRRQLWLRRSLPALALLLGACGSSSDMHGRSVSEHGSCAADQWCAGAAKVVVTPEQTQIDGIEESRLFLGSKTQFFNLGGFGIDPTQNLPNPLAQLGNMLTQPAQARVHHAGRSNTDEHTWLRAAVLALGETRLVFVTLDAIGAGNLIQDGLRAAIVEASCAVDWCIDADHIVFGQTHSHAGADLQGLWGGVPQDWIDHTLYPAAAEAVRQAIAAREGATLSIAQGQTHAFNNYRRPRVVADAQPDPHLSLLRIEAAGSARPIAQIMQYAAHPTSINEDPRVPHADYIYGAMQTLEKRGGVGLYYNGPIADASGAGGACAAEPEDAYARVYCRGEAIANTALALPRRALPAELSLRNVTAILPVTNPLFLAAAPLGALNRYYNFTPTPITQIPVLGDIVSTIQNQIGQVPSTAQTLVTRISLGGVGGLEIATIPGEATHTFGQIIRDLAETANPGAQVMLLGLTQNSFGYILPEDEFSYIDASGDTGFLIPFTGYEEFVSLGPLTAPLLRLQAYVPLFDGGLSAAIPDYLSSCFEGGPADARCLLADLARKLEYVQASLKSQCLEAGAPEAFCGLLNPQTPLSELCLRVSLLPADVCGLLGEVGASGAAMMTR